MPGLHSAGFDNRGVWIATGEAKVQADFRRLREMGIVDAEGKQLKTIVFADVLNATSDFGG